MGIRNPALIAIIVLAVAVVNAVPAMARHHGHAPRIHKEARGRVLPVHRYRPAPEPRKRTSEPPSGTLDPLDAWLGFAPARYYPGIDVVTVTIDRPERGYFYGGEIALRDPDTGLVLGRYRFGSGGAARGSAPFGEYIVGEYREDSNIGPRWNLRQHGRGEGEVWDPQIKDVRTWIELHMAHTRDGATFGCLSVLGGEEVWARFVGQMQGLVARLGRVTFTVGLGSGRMKPLVHFVNAGVLL